MGFLLEYKWLEVQMYSLGKELLQFRCDVVKVIFQPFNLFVKFLLFNLSSHWTSVHLIQGESYDDTVEEDFIKSFDSFFQSYLLLEFLHFLLLCWFYYFPINPMLCARVLSSESDKETIQELEFFFLMFFLCNGEHWFSHGTND